MIMCSLFQSNQLHPSSGFRRKDGGNWFFQDSGVFVQTNGITSQKEIILSVTTMRTLGLVYVNGSISLFQKFYCSCFEML